VKYYRNATLLYTSTVAPQYPLLVDTSLNTVCSGIYNVVITSTAPLKRNHSMAGHRSVGHAAHGV
jgi:hypothetical protein